MGQERENLVLINYQALLHEPLNLEGAKIFRQNLEELFTSPFDKYVIFLEGAGATADEVRSMKRQAKYSGFRNNVVHNVLFQQLQRKPSDLEISTRMRLIEEDQDVDEVLSKKLLTDQDLFEYYFRRTFDQLGGSKNIQFEFETHSREINQVEKQIHAQSKSTGLMARSRWNQGEFWDAISNFREFLSKLHQSDSIREDDLVESVTNQLSLLTSVDQPVCAVLAYGASHHVIMDRLFSNFRERQFRYFSYLGSHRDSIERKVDLCLHQEEVVPDDLAAQLLLKQITKEVICVSMKKAEKVSILANVYEQMTIKVDRAVSSLSLSDIRRLCGGEDRGREFMQRIFVSH